MVILYGSCPHQETTSAQRLTRQDRCSVILSRCVVGWRFPSPRANPGSWLLSWGSLWPSNAITLAGTPFHLSTGCCRYVCTSVWGHVLLSFGWQRRLFAQIINVMQILASIFSLFFCQLLSVLFCFFFVWGGRGRVLLLGRAFLCFNEFPFQAVFSLALLCHFFIWFQTFFSFLRKIVLSFI